MSADAPASPGEMETPQHAVRQLVQYAQAGPPARELPQAFVEFFGPDVEAQDLPGHSASTGALFIEWFLFDRPMSSGDTPAVQYALASPTLSADQRRAFFQLADTVPGFFEVAGVAAGGMWLSLFPAPGRRSAGEATSHAMWVEEPAAPRSLSRGDVIWTRLLRWNAQWHLATCCFVLPPDARELLRPLAMLRPRYSERAWRRLMATLEPQFFRDLILVSDAPGPLAPHDALPLTATERAYYLSQAESLLRKGHVREALRAFWRVLADAPLDARAMLGVARARMAQGRILAAEKAFRALLRHHPHHAQALSELGQLLEARGSLDEAEQLLQRAAKMGAANRRALLSLGRIALQKGRWAFALEQFSRAVALGKGRAVSGKGLPGSTSRSSAATAALALEAGWQLLESGQISEAQVFFHQACEGARTRSERASAWHGLGLVLARERRFLEGAAALLQALRLGIGRPKLWAEVGRLYARVGRLREAEVAYRASVAQLPGYVPGLIGLASVLLRLGRPDEALRAAERACAIVPDEPQVLRVLGSCHLRKGRLGKALELLDRALLLNPRDINARSLRTRAAMELKASRRPRSEPPVR